MSLTATTHRKLRIAAKAFWDAFHPKFCCTMRADDWENESRFVFVNAALFHALARARCWHRLDPAESAHNVQLAPLGQTATPLYDSSAQPAVFGSGMRRHYAVCIQLHVVCSVP